MPTVDIKIHNANYKVACAEGEEKRLHGLAEKLDKRVAALSGQVKAGDTLLLLLAALMLEDEVTELRSRNDKRPKKSFHINEEGQQELFDTEAVIETRTHIAVAEAIDAMAEYVEGIAKKYQNC